MHNNIGYRIVIFGTACMLIIRTTVTTLAFTTTKAIRSTTSTAQMSWLSSSSFVVNAKKPNGDDNCNNAINIHNDNDDATTAKNYQSLRFCDIGAKYVPVVTHQYIGGCSECVVSTVLNVERKIITLEIIFRKYVFYIHAFI